MRKKRKDSVYVQHIFEALEKIIDFVSDHSYKDFLESEWDQDAAIRNLEIIGEAANNLGGNFKKKYMEIPWREIVDFRNIIVHDYADLDLQVVWEIMTNDMSKLHQKINQILKDYQE